MKLDVTPSRNERLNEQLLAYWQTKAQPLPTEADIQPSELTHIWPSCFLLNVEEKNFRYDYLGEDLIEAYGISGAQHAMCETLLQPDSPTLFNAIQQAIHTRAPVQDEGEFVNQLGLKICYRAVILPLLRDAQSGVAYVLGGMRFKPYARYEKTPH